MRKRHWKYHVVRLSAGTLLAVLIGWWFDRPVLLPVIFLLGYLAWLFYNSIRLYRWLQSWDTDPPESLGMWSEMFERIAALQKQNIKRNRQYQSVIDDFESLADAFPDATVEIGRAHV